MLNLTALAVALSAALQGIPTRNAFNSVQVGQEPNRPFTDVGPIQAPDVSTEAAMRQRLQIIADELDIDGFIIETRNPMIVYGVREKGVDGARDDAFASNGADGAASEAVNALGLKTLRTVFGMKKEIIFLRAYSIAAIPPERAAELRENAQQLFKGKIKLGDMAAKQRHLLNDERPSR